MLALDTRSALMICHAAMLADVMLLPYDGALDGRLRHDILRLPRHADDADAMLTLSARRVTFR